MKNEAESLTKRAERDFQFLLRFAALSANIVAKPEKWATYSTGVSKVLNPGPGTLADDGGFITEPRGPANLPQSATEWLALQRDIKQLFDALVEQRERKSGGGFVANLRLSNLHVSVVSMQNLVPPKWRGPADPIVLMIGGATRDVLLYRILRLLERVGTDRIRKCPGCLRVFFRTTRKKITCSERCYGKLYMRERRKKEKLGARKEVRRGKTRKR